MQVPEIASQSCVAANTLLLHSLHVEDSVETQLLAPGPCPTMKWMKMMKESSYYSNFLKNAHCEGSIEEMMTASAVTVRKSVTAGHCVARFDVCLQKCEEMSFLIVVSEAEKEVLQMNSLPSRVKVIVCSFPYYSVVKVDWRAQKLVANVK